jgi:hypothetical protein
LAALRIRNRQRRRSTVSDGQVRPLTTDMFPKNSGFQNGGTSVVGMNGPPAGTSPKKSLELGKNSDPSALNDRSWITSGISRYRTPAGSPGCGAGPGSTPAGRSFDPPRSRYIPVSPA